MDKVRSVFRMRLRIAHPVSEVRQNKTVVGIAQAPRRLLGHSCIRRIVHEFDVFRRVGHRKEAVARERCAVIQRQSKGQVREEGVVGKGHKWRVNVGQFFVRACLEDGDGNTVLSKEFDMRAVHFSGR